MQRRGGHPHLLHARICVQHCEREEACFDPDAFLPCEDECALLYTLAAIDAPDCIEHYDDDYACLSGFDCADPARDQHCASDLEAFEACGFMVSASGG
jgi:hypothetical protein